MRPLLIIGSDDGLGGDELSFIKPCTQAEIDFYESSVASYPDFAEFMPSSISNLEADEQHLVSEAKKSLGTSIARSSEAKNLEPSAFVPNYMKGGWLDEHLSDNIETEIEADFEVESNRFAFSPGQLNKLINPKSLLAFYALGGLAGLEKGLRADKMSGLSRDGDTKVSPMRKPGGEATKEDNGRFICTWTGCTEETKHFNRKCEWAKHM